MLAPPATSVIRDLPRLYRHERYRSMVEFAEAEIVLPTGPMAGEKFDFRFMPWTKLLVEEYDRGSYREYWLSGPVQGGKTLLGFQLPCLYHLFEQRVPVILGVPKIEMGAAIYHERLLPMIERTRYRELLPASGAGSRGGRVEAISFRHGVTLRFMGAGGGDEQRASHTAPVIILTEVDKYDRAALASRETDPVTQIIARSKAFWGSGQARIYGECTMSSEKGRIYHEVVEEGTHTQVAVSCPLCGAYNVPLRESFKGWEGHEDVIAARSGGYYECPSCSKPWDDAVRRKALRTPILLSDGQEIIRKKAGKSIKIKGELRKTVKFGFRWNSLVASPDLTSMADLAEQEWLAERESTAEARKNLAQFVWTEPHDEISSSSLHGFTRSSVFAKVTEQPRSIIPAEASSLTAFLDLGLHHLWWVVCAWAEDWRGWIVDYGMIEVPQGHQPDPARVFEVAEKFLRGTVQVGWLDATLASKQPDIVLIDSGWETKATYRLCESFPARFFPSKGHGTARDQESWTPGKKAPRVLSGDEWRLSVPEGTRARLISLYSDHWKAKVHSGFVLPVGAAESLHLFHATRRQLAEFAAHMASEVQEAVFTPGFGSKVFWNRVSPDNHWLDCVAGCYAAESVRRRVGAKIARQEAGIVAASPAPNVPDRSYKPKDKGKERPRWRIGR